MIEITAIEQRLSNIEALLTATKTVLTFDEACNYTGFAKSFMYKMTSTGKIPCYKPQGKMIYFDRAELEKWLLRNRITPANEINEIADTYVSLNQKGGAK
ncbi:MAG: helix-turn-helix domain-containing protein [Bacteroidota bacterium]